MASVELKGLGKIYDGDVRAVEDVISLLKTVSLWCWSAPVAAKVPRFGWWPDLKTSQRRPRYRWQACQ